MSCLNYDALHGGYSALAGLLTDSPKKVALANRFTAKNVRAALCFTRFDPLDFNVYSN